MPLNFRTAFSQFFCAIYTLVIKNLHSELLQKKYTISTYMQYRDLRVKKKLFCYSLSYFSFVLVEWNSRSIFNMHLLLLFHIFYMQLYAYFCVVAHNLIAYCCKWRAMVFFLAENMRSIAIYSSLTFDIFEEFTYTKNEDSILNQVSYIEV